MIEKMGKQQIFDYFLGNIISKAREASDSVKASFLINSNFRGNYIRAHILFVCDTQHMNIESELDEWFKIYSWIEEKKEEMFLKNEIENLFIVLYPRFINFIEYSQLNNLEKERLDRKRISWHEEFEVFR